MKHYDIKITLLFVLLTSLFLGFAATNHQFLAFWKRSLWMGLAVVVLMATGKIIWSIQNAVNSGKSILIPAIIGLALCTAFIYYGFKRLEKKRNL